MAELVDATDLKSVIRKDVGVRVPPRARNYYFKIFYRGASPSDNKYVERVRKISSRYGLGIKIFTIGGTGSSSNSPKPRASGEKEFWITSSGKTHNSSCRYYGTTKSGRYSDKPSGDSCKVCGG